MTNHPNRKQGYFVVEVNGRLDPVRANDYDLACITALQRVLGDQDFLIFDESDYPLIHGAKKHTVCEVSKEVYEWVRDHPGWLEYAVAEGMLTFYCVDNNSRGLPPPPSLRATVEYVDHDSSYASLVEVITEADGWYNEKDRTLQDYREYETWMHGMHQAGVMLAQCTGSANPNDEELNEATENAEWDTLPAICLDAAKRLWGKHYGLEGKELEESFSKECKRIY